MTTASLPTRTFDAVVDLARATADHGDEHRALAPALVDAAKAEGLFCLLLPESLGGLEAMPAEAVDVLERMAHADGAAGWCAFIGNATGFFGWLDPEVARPMLVDAPAVSAVSIFAPMGVAVPEGDGYRINGQWGFASGSGHSEWFQVGVMVMDGDRPAMRADGSPDWRFAYLPSSDVEILDTWDTIGLRGTGSNDVVVQGALIGPERLAMPMFDAPQAVDPVFQLGFWGLLPLLMAPFVLGVARRSLDELEVALAAENPRPGRATLKEDPQVHHELGRARASLVAARAGLDQATGQAWDAVLSGRPAGQVEHDGLGLAAQHANQVALDIVDVAYRFAPSGVIRHGDVIQRCFRDLHTSRKHIAFGLDGFRGPGRRALGLP
jgi:alkylation response protein AidB-like acyl-CoA dehydrogenase